MARKASRSFGNSGELFIGFVSNRFYPIWAPRVTLAVRYFSTQYWGIRTVLICIPFRCNIKPQLGGVASFQAMDARSASERELATPIFAS